MIESVSNTPSINNIQAMDKISKEKLSAPGKYTIDELLEQTTLPSQKEEKESDGGFLGFLGKLILSAIVIGAGSIALKRYIPAFSELKVTEELRKNAKGSEKLKIDFVRFAEWVEKNSIGLFNRLKETTAKAANKTGTEVPG